MLKCIELKAVGKQRQGAEDMESLITDQDCVNILKKEYENVSEGDILKKRIAPLSDTCVGFLGAHSVLSIETKNNRVKTFFMKTKPKMKNQVNFVNDTNAFEKEYKSYKKLLPSLLKISRSYGEKWGPECYLTRSDVIVLEHLKQYQLSKTGHLFDCEHLACALRALAHFHSASVIFEYHASANVANCRINQLYPDCIVESTYTDDKNNVRWNWFYNGANIVLDMVTLMDKYNEKELSRMRNELPKMLDRIKGRFKPSANHTNVLCHGDLWSNNMMFKYVDVKPVSCRLVDFQIGRYAPYITDLISLIYLTTDKLTRTQNMKHFLQIYLEAFNEQLVNADTPKTLQLTESIIHRDFESFRESILFEACLFEMNTSLDDEIFDEIISTEENIRDFFYGNRSKVVMPLFKKGGQFYERMCELIGEFVEDYILIE